MHGVLAAGVRSNMDAVFLVFLIDWNTSVYFDRNKTLTLQKLALLSCKILGNVGWVKNVVDSTRFDRIDWSLWPRFTNEEGSCIFISRILTSGGLCRVGWKCCRFVMPEVDLREARLRANRVESLSASYESSEVSCYVLRTRMVHVSLFHGSWLPGVRIDAARIESNRKVPQTNRLTLDVLDMDGAILWVCQ